MVCVSAVVKRCSRKLGVRFAKGRRKRCFLCAKAKGWRKAGGRLAEAQMMGVTNSGGGRRRKLGVRFAKMG